MSTEAISNAFYSCAVRLFGLAPSTDRKRVAFLTRPAGDWSLRRPTSARLEW